MAALSLGILALLSSCNRDDEAAGDSLRPSSRVVERSVGSSATHLEDKELWNNAVKENPSLASSDELKIKFISEFAREGDIAAIYHLLRQLLVEMDDPSRATAFLEQVLEDDRLDHLGSRFFQMICDAGGASSLELVKWVDSRRNERQRKNFMVLQNFSLALSDTPRLLPEIMRAQAKSDKDFVGNCRALYARLTMLPATTITLTADADSRRRLAETGVGSTGNTRDLATLDVSRLGDSLESIFTEDEIDEIKGAVIATSFDEPDLSSIQSMARENSIEPSLLADSVLANEIRAFTLLEKDFGGWTQLLSFDEQSQARSNLTRFLASDGRVADFPDNLESLPQEHRGTVARDASMRILMLYGKKTFLETAEQLEQDSRRSFVNGVERYWAARGGSGPDKSVLLDLLNEQRE